MARYNWRQCPVPGRGPAVEKHCPIGNLFAFCLSVVCPTQIKPYGRLPWLYAVPFCKRNRIHHSTFGYAISALKNVFELAANFRMLQNYEMRYLHSDALCHLLMSSLGSQSTVILPVGPEAPHPKITRRNNNTKLTNCTRAPHVVCPCHHDMARPQVADRGTASDKEGSCE